MVAVQDQRRQLEKWRAKFTPTVTRQLNNLFIHLVIQSVYTHLFPFNNFFFLLRAMIQEKPVVKALEVQTLRKQQCHWLNTGNCILSYKCMHP